MSFEDGVADGNEQTLNDRGGRRGDDVLHLHRFHDEQALSCPDHSSFAHIDRDHCSLHGCVHGDGAGFEVIFDAPRSNGRIDLRLAVVQDGERIASIDSRPGERRRTRSRRRHRRFEEHCAPIRRGRYREQIVDVIFDEARVRAVRDEVRMTQHGSQEADVRGDAFDAELIERA